MDGGNKVIGLWRDRENAPPSSSSASGDVPFYVSEDEEDFVPTGHWRKPLAIGLFATTALGWLGAISYSRYLAWSENSPGLEEILTTIATASAPLALIAAAWLLILRSSRSEANAFARTAHALRNESERMDTVLAFVSARIEASRRDLAEQSDALLNLGEGTAARLNDATNAIRKEIDTITGHTQALKGTTAAARGDLAVLLSHLPKAQVQMRQIAASLVEAGTSAQDRAVELGEKVAELAVRTTEAEETAEKTTSELKTQLEQLIENSRNLATLASETETNLREAGAQSTTELKDRVLAIGTEVDRISATFGNHDEASRALATRISSDLGELETRFAAFDAHGKERAEQLSTSLSSLHERASELQTALNAGEGDISGLTTKTEALLTALDNAAREIDETMPAAFGRLEETAGKAMTMVDQSAPALLSVAKSAESMLENLGAAEKIVERQQGEMASIADNAASLLLQSQTQAEALSSAVRAATQDLQTLADGASANLVEALIRAKETAKQAADHSRDAFNAVIPETANSFGEQSKKALGEALTQQVEAQMREIAATTEQAVAAAQKATDRLMRQMLTISETSASLERRISEAKEEAEQADTGNFARRVALLIESLNSAAIDVTKILSNDVTDTAWAAYLRGDRGVFSRRAVRLLDNSDAREIVRHYQDDQDFREQVNRYIHDYEAMLRNVMSARDGTPLSVALLSSDTGKLYVALAQAIERLRA